MTLKTDDKLIQEMVKFNYCYVTNVILEKTRFSRKNCVINRHSM